MKAIDAANEKLAQHIKILNKREKQLTDTMLNAHEHPDKLKQRYKEIKRSMEESSLTSDDDESVDNNILAGGLGMASKAKPATMLSATNMIPASLATDKRRQAMTPNPANVTIKRVTNTDPKNL